MVTIRRPALSALIPALAALLIVCAPSVGNSEDSRTGNWKTYSNSKAGFTFRYPGDWEIIDDGFYETAGGHRSKVRMVTLQKVGDESSDNWIRINPRQFDDTDGKCISLDKKECGQRICTYGKVPEVLQVFDGIAAGFKFKRAGAARKCYEYDPVLVTLRGVLKRVSSPGAPNYESVRDGDAPEERWVLHLHGFYSCGTGPVPINRKRRGFEDCASFMARMKNLRYQVVLWMPTTSFIRRHVWSTVKALRERDGTHGLEMSKMWYG